MKRPTLAITYTDGCVVTYSHPDGNPYPRAELTSPTLMVHVHNEPDDSAISQAVGKAFIEALRSSPSYGSKEPA